MTRIRRCQPDLRAGTASVELAVALPLLVIMLLGIWEVGRLVQVQQVLINAAREGARSASTSARSPAEVEATIRTYLTAAGINVDGCTVRIINLTQNPNAAGTASDDPTYAAQLDRLRVIVTLPFRNVKWAFAQQLTNVHTLKASVDWYCMKDHPVEIDTSMPRG